MFFNHLLFHRYFHCTLRSDFIHLYKGLLGMSNDSSVAHKDAQGTSFQHDDRGTIKVISCLHALQVNLFETAAGMMSISSSITATYDVRDTVHNAYSKEEGSLCVLSFFNDCLLSKKLRFHDSILLL